MFGCLLRNRFIVHTVLKNQYLVLIGDIGGTSSDCSTTAGEVLVKIHMTERRHVYTLDRSDELTFKEDAMRVKQSTVDTSHCC